MELIIINKQGWEVLNATVTYSLRHVCDGCTATLIPQILRRPTVLCKPYGDLTVFSSPQGHLKSCGFFFNFTLNFFQKPQCRNAVTTPQGHHTVALWWPWGDIFFLPCLGCRENRTVSSGHPCNSLTVPLRRLYSKFVVAATTVRVLYGCRMVSLRLPYGCWSHESYDCHAVAVTFVTTATIAHKTLRFLKITFYKP